MVAYWVTRSNVNDPDQYKKDTDLVPGILQEFGGEILARGGKFKILEGQRNSTASSSSSSRAREAVACYEPPAYLEAAAHHKKDGASGLEIVILESA